VVEGRKEREIIMYFDIKKGRERYGFLLARRIDNNKKYVTSEPG
jgi:hypothetical protein